MFGGAAGHALAPHPERGPFHVLAHQLNDFTFLEPELVMNGFEWRAVFPRHFDNSVELKVS
jgi:hypothetical protein